MAGSNFACNFKGDCVALVGKIHGRNGWVNGFSILIANINCGLNSIQEAEFGFSICFSELTGNLKGDLVTLIREIDSRNGWVDCFSNLVSNVNCGLEGTEQPEFRFSLRFSFSKLAGYF